MINTATFFNRLRIYVNAGFLLHLIAAIECFFICLILPGLMQYAPASSSGMILLKYLSIQALICLPVFAQLDARSRYQNYKKIKDQLYVYGFDRRILRPSLKSRCLRNAALAAAKETGYHRQCRNYYRSAGYRWYHLLPDFVFQQPLFVFNRHFWVSTFFAPTYTAKVGRSKQPERQLRNQVDFY
jgi:hypothetical protein